MVKVAEPVTTVRFDTPAGLVTCDVEVKNGDTYVNGARITATIDASNGVVHVVDKVFLFD